MEGFIITSDWLDQDGIQYLRFFGRGSDGAFELIVTDFRPYFFIPQDCSHELKQFSAKRQSSPLASFSGIHLDRLEFPTQGDLLRAKTFLENRDCQTFEADIKPTDRYLMDRCINASFRLEGFQDQGSYGQVTRYLNPVLAKSDFQPESFRVLSIDIETSRGGQVISVGLHFWQSGEPDREAREVLVLGDLSGEAIPDVLVLPLPNERSLLEGLSEAIGRFDPDLIIGWNVIDFDFSFLAKRFESFGLKPDWGKHGGGVRFSQGGSLGQRMHLDGRLVIDGPSTLRLAFFRFENYRLQTVAQELLGKGKDIVQSDSWTEIERRFREDKYALARYNIADCELVSEIFQKTNLISLQATRSRISGLLMGSVGLSTRAFDHFLIPQAHRYHLAAFNVKDTHRSEHSAGGHVLDPKVGLYEHVIVLDFKSLYPSIINTFKIDPIARQLAKEEDIETPTGFRMSRNQHALPNLIEDLLRKRKKAKEEKDQDLSYAIKILMNSFYGVMGSGGSRFYHPDLPTAITGAGRWILKSAESYLQNKGYDVLYGDTDSVFVLLKEEDHGDPTAAGDLIAKDLNEYLQKVLKEEFAVHSYLEIEFEKYYERFFLPPSRGQQTKGSKKRYAGLLVNGAKKEVHFTGLEFVRSDWTRVAKDFQFELMRRVFFNEPMGEWVKEFVGDIRLGKKDVDLVYKKRLTKPAAEYKKSRPPHVKAALQLSPAELNELGRKPTIEYLMTRQGPVPTKLDVTNIDYDHYIEKQIKPIADSVLWIYGQRFDDLFHGVQKALFESV